MPANGERQILGPHAAAIVDHAQQRLATAGGRHLDAGGACVDRILDQFLRRALQELGRGPGVHIEVALDVGEVQAGSRNIPVDFGSVPNDSFTGVGSRAVDRDFNINLRCQGSNVAQYQSTIGIQLDAIYGGGVPGTWTGDDSVQPLGGAGTLQGCED